VPCLHRSAYRVPPGKLREAARALCTPSPDRDLLALGLEPGDLPSEELAIWPENEPAVRLFAALQSQWLVGPMGGVVGLRYEAMPAVEKRIGIKRKQRCRVFAGLRTMEIAALEVLNGR
jgi:hypothetical protein